MRYIQQYESFGGEFPREITSQQWKDLEIIEYDEYGGIVKNTPIPPYLCREMFGRRPITKHLYVIYFKPKDDAPFYLIRFTTDNTPPERVQREKGYIKLYMADDFEQVKNFCKVHL
jgi:hypothetical protein